MSRRHCRTALVTFVVILCSAQLGCFKEKPVTRPPESGLTRGRILVDSPEVYGRERLARDRLEQTQWLEDQLEAVDEADFSKFQGATQQQSLDSRRFRAGVDARIQTALAIEETRAEAAALDRQNRLEELRHEIEVRRLEQELEALEQQGAEGDIDNDAGDGGASDGEIEAPSGVLESLLNDPLAASPDQLPGTTLATTGLADRPIDVFLKKLAFRERVRQELLENNLDDVHDLDGNTLYRLTFDTTVFPEHDTSHWAIVEIELEDPFSDCTGSTLDVLQPIWNRWLDALEVRLNDEVDQLQDLVLDPSRTQDQLSEREDRFVTRALAKLDALSVLQIPQMDTKLESLVVTYRKTLYESNDSLDPAMLRQAVRDAALEVIRDSYQSELNPPDDPSFVEIRIDGADKKRLLTCKGTPRAQHVPNFCKALQRRRQANAISAYAITPKVTVERVSNVRASRVARELALGLAATAGPAQFETAFEKAQVLDAATQAILRQPLVVGFSEVVRTYHPDPDLDPWEFVDRAEEAAREAEAARSGAHAAAAEAARAICEAKAGLASQGGFDDPTVGCRKRSSLNQLRFEESARPIFGWILGPRFKARHDGDGYDFRFAPHGDALSAVISVPAWWPRVDLIVRTCWVPESFVPPSQRICHDPTSVDRDVKYAVRLGGNNQAITTALAPSRRQPSARLNGGKVLEVGRTGKLILVGTELWRNPTVTLGTQTADSVEVLPDMEGLIASFDSVIRPAGWTSQQRLGREQIWLWTSEGRTFAGTAEIHLAPSATTAAPRPKFRMTTPVQRLTVDSKKKAKVTVLFTATDQKPKIVIGVEGAEVEEAKPRPETACTVTQSGHSRRIDGIAKNKSCTVDLTLRNVGEDTVTLTAYQDIPPLKAPYPSITLLAN